MTNKSALSLKKQRYPKNVIPTIKARHKDAVSFSRGQQKLEKVEYLYNEAMDAVRKLSKKQTSPT